MFTLSEGLHLITVIELTQDMAENCHIYILFRLKIALSLREIHNQSYPKPRSDL